MATITFKVNSLVSDSYGNQNENYTFNLEDTLNEVLDHLSIKYNYDFFRHSRSVVIVSDYDKYTSSILVKDTGLKLKDFSLGKNIRISINMTPSNVSLHINEGYVRKNKD